MKLQALLKNYDWERIDPEAPPKHQANTRTVRIYDARTGDYPAPYFEVGRSSPSSGNACPIDKFLRSDVLNAEVDEYWVDEYLAILCITLKGEE